MKTSEFIAIFVNKKEFRFIIEILFFSIF